MRHTNYLKLGLLVGLCFALLLFPSTAIKAQTPSAQELRGEVVSPDGTPVAGATVVATSICEQRFQGDTKARPSKEKTTAQDGTFSFPVFEPDCNRYSFSASKKADYWLPSDEDSSTGETPAAPVVVVSDRSATQPIRIVLRVRGGEVSFQVWDIATGRLVRAELGIVRKPVGGKKFGSISIATGKDGSPASRLLAPGEYAVTVRSYPCREKEYWTARGPVHSFMVGPGTHLEETISIDVRNIRPLPVFDGRQVENCNP
jgi:hypothetical protein